MKRNKMVDVKLSSSTSTLNINYLKTSIRKK